MHVIAVCEEDALPEAKYRTHEVGMALVPASPTRETSVVQRNDRHGLVQLVVRKDGRFFHVLHDSSRIDLVAFDGMGNRALSDREKVRQSHRGVDHVDLIMRTFCGP